MARKADELYRRLMDQGCRDFVLKQFSEISSTIKKIELEISATIKADRSMLCHVIKDSTLLLQDAEKCSSIREACSVIKGELSIFAINDVLLSDVKLEDLEYHENMLLRDGSFGAVFKWKLITEDKKTLDVAVKVSEKVITTKNASMLLEKEQIISTVSAKPKHTILTVVLYLMIFPEQINHFQHFSVISFTSMTPRY